VHQGAGERLLRDIFGGRSIGAGEQKRSDQPAVVELVTGDEVGRR
jgi:hypothetical protein